MSKGVVCVFVGGVGGDDRWTLAYTTIHTHIYIIYTYHPPHITYVDRSRSYLVDEAGQALLLPPVPMGVGGVGVVVRIIVLVEGQPVCFLCLCV